MEAEEEVLCVPFDRNGSHVEDGITDGREDEGRNQSSSLPRESGSGDEEDEDCNFHFFRANRPFIIHDTPERTVRKICLLYTSPSPRDS